MSKLLDFLKKHNVELVWSQGDDVSRYSLMNGKFGDYFYDHESVRDMPLQDVLDTLNSSTTTILTRKIEALQAQLADANEVVTFYCQNTPMCGEHEFTSNDEATYKRARAYLTKWGEK